MASPLLLPTLHASLPFLTLCAAILISVTLAGKRLCFSVFVGHLTGTPCGKMENCSVGRLNMIGDFGAGLTYILTPLMTGLVIKGGLTYANTILQFGAVFVFGCIVSEFCFDPDSLIVTDSLIQGIGAAAIISLIALRVNEYFPRDSQHHVLVTSLAEGGPVGIIVFCPVMAAIIDNYNWRTVYAFIGALVLIECLASNLIDHANTSGDETEVAQLEPERQQTASLLPTNAATTGASGDTEAETTDDEYEGVTPMEPIRSDEIANRAAATYGEFSRLFTGVTFPELCQKPHVIIWCLERALYKVVYYSIIMNLVRYVQVVINDKLPDASLIMLAFGGGEIIGFIIAMAIADFLRDRLLFIYIISSVVMFSTLCTWHILQLHKKDEFTQSDCYFMTFITGLAAIFSNVYTYAMSENVVEMPGAVSYPLTRLAQGVGILIAPLLSGVIIDYSGFSQFFLVQSMLCLLRVLLLVSLALLHRRYRSESAGYSEIH